MVALKRFFHAEKSPSSPDSLDQDLLNQSQPQYDHASSLALNSKGRQFWNGNDHFQKIERQFEVMHDQLQARPFSPPTHIPLSHVSSRLANRDARHIDLLDALFSSHRYQMPSPGAISPITPYNEDVAERNMTPFLQTQQAGTQNVYSRILSALYQEDVADRNIARSRRRSRSLSRNTTQSRATSAYSYQAGFQQNWDGVKGRPRSKTKESQSYSPDSSCSVSKSQQDEMANSSNETPPSHGGSLRTHRSAPTVLSEQVSRTERHLGVPPAFKQGDSWTSTPLPDSPTLPVTLGYNAHLSNQNQGQQDSPAASTPSPRLPATPKDGRPPISPRVGSRRNVRDLSINTELAAWGRPRKIAHRAIQPPTPSNFEIKQNPSIAEIMNSPLPVATPHTLSPLPNSTQNVAEIMDMFRKAYASTQAITPHPTFETLQDAIIREINSHEAFRRVPIPEPGPPFTPYPSQDSFDRSASAPKSSSPSSLKEGQLSKLIRKGSSKRHRRGSDLRKSISTSVPSRVFRRASENPRRRRHTDAPPPSPGFFDTMEPTGAGSEDPVTYVDLLLRSEKPIYSRCASGLSTNPSVLYMRAQTSGSDSDSRASFSADDSDDEIIHLPSVGLIPQVQIQGVDENNVTYIAENTTPRNAYRLMNWPRKSNRSTSLRSTFANGDSGTS